MIDNVTEISKAQLLSEAQKMSSQGFRLVTSTCVDLGEDNLDVLYHFDKGTQLQNFAHQGEAGRRNPEYLIGLFMCCPYRKRNERIVRPERYGDSH